jgi:glycosyltransferase involved in cell wall biosynthesis
LPTVSIIIPNYNHSKFLDLRLQSILSQDFLDFEVIVLDDASNDHSIDLINSYKNYKSFSQIIVNKKNSGSTFKQWKKGITLAKGKYIWIAESDDYCDSNFLSSTIEILENDHSIGLVYCQSNIVDENNEYLFNERAWFDKLDAYRWVNSFKMNGLEHVFKHMTDFNTIPNASAVVFRRELIQLKDIPTDFKYSGDWYFWITLLSRTNLFYIAQPLNFFRSSSQSTRSNQTLGKKIKIIEERIKIINKLNSFKNETKLINEKQILLKQYIDLVSWKDLIKSSFFLIEFIIKNPISTISQLNKKYLK